jgi:Domain of unknown function (DUF1963)
VTDETVDLVARFRSETAARGLPPDTVEYWIRTARPAVYLAEGGEGPLAAQFGGDPMLPDDAPEPYGDFVAAVDCALLPPNATDLPLPPGGQLLFFAVAEVMGHGVQPGRVVYVPADMPTTRRLGETGARQAYESRQLRTLWHQMSWPNGPDGYHDDGKRLEGNYMLLDQLAAAWSHVVGWRPGWTLQIGGHPNFMNWDPVEVACDETPGGDDSGGSGAGDGSDWVLLASWECGEDVSELDHGLVHWVIRRRDLAALRFDRVFLYVDML